MADDDFSAWPIETMSYGKTTPLPRIDGPLRNTESISDVLQHLRDEGITEADDWLRARNIDPTLPAIELQKELREKLGKK